MEDLGSLEDRASIHELNQRYAVHVDLKEPDAWAELFTEDVLFDEQEFGTPPMSSREEVRAYGQFLAANVRHALHHMTTHAISDLTETTARGVAFAVVEAQLNDGDHARHHVIYHDRYAKVDGSWLFAERILKSSLPSETFEPSP